MSRQIIKRGTLWRGDLVSGRSAPKKLDAILQKIRVLASWGQIGGDLSTQADLAAALAGKAARSQNLADLSNAATARENLGLRSGAVHDVPATGDAAADQLVLGADSRLGTGASGVQTVSAGDSTITIGGIATAPTVMVTANTFDSKGAALAAGSAAQAYCDSTTLSKSSNLGDIANSATARANLGLGSSATHDANDFDSAGAAAAAVSSAESYTDAQALAKASNLSDVASAATARDNLGIGAVVSCGSRTLPDTALTVAPVQVGGDLVFTNPGAAVAAFFRATANTDFTGCAKTASITVMLQWSADGGATWTSGQQLTANVANNVASIPAALPVSAEAFMPAQTPSGAIHVRLIGSITSTGSAETIRNLTVSGMLFPSANFSAP